MQRYSIYQLKSGVKTRFLRWKPYQQLLANGLEPNFANYMYVYSGETAKESPDKMLETIYLFLTLNPPVDYSGHPLSVSDVIIFHTEGGDKAYYVDSSGYVELTNFTQSQRQNKKR